MSIVIRAAHRGPTAPPAPPPASGYLLDNLGNILIFVAGGVRILQG